jgi:hypothetical protein
MKFYCLNGKQQQNIQHKVFTINRIVRQDRQMGSEKLNRFQQNILSRCLHYLFSISFVVKQG